MNTGLGILITLLGGIFWGFSGVAGKYLFDYVGVTSDWLVPWRLLTAGTLLLLYLYKKEGKKIFRILRDDFFSLLIYAIFGMMACQYTYFTAVQYSNAAIATVLQYSTPPLIMIYMCCKERKKPLLTEVISLFLATFGVFVLSTHLQFQSFVVSPQALVWGLLSALMMSINTVQPVKLLKKYGAFLPLAWAMLLGGLILFAYTKPYRLEVHYSLELLGGFLAVVLLGTVFAFSLYMEGIKRIGPTKASLIACVEPISATLLSMLFLKTNLHFYDLLGIAFILSAVFILSFASKGESRELEKE